MSGKSDIAVIGLAVMGKNLILNMADHGFRVTAFNRTISKVEEFKANEARDFDNIFGATSLEDMINSLETPRRVMLMVKAGDAVDKTINSLLPYLNKGDIIIDGGNSNYVDTERRVRELSTKDIHFVGSGISGGEEGARFGPSIMPGGDESAWKSVEPILTAISAKTKENEACCQWIGGGGSGHFVKMVHNGIEYGDMQLIAETYDIIRQRTGLETDAIAEIFEQWNEGDLDSYLIEITAKVLRRKDEDGEPLIDKILDVAGQKGTGRWTVEAALDSGAPLSLITESVYARSLSARFAERQVANALFDGPIVATDREHSTLINDLEKALYAAKVISYAQGFSLMADASRENGWQLNFSGIARIWKEGCIIRSAFLDDIAKAFEKNETLQNLLFDEFFAQIMRDGVDALRRVVIAGVEAGVPTPSFSAGLSYFDTLRSVDLSTSLVQGQRDYFGAHTYERRDQPRGKFFHTNWLGE